MSQGQISPQVRFQQDPCKSGGGAGALPGLECIKIGRCSLSGKTLLVIGNAES